MGRLIAVILFIAVLVPGVLLARAWWLASGRRAVAGGSASSWPSRPPRASRTLHRQAQHGRRIRRLGLLLGMAGVIGSVMLFAEASVFLWVPVARRRPARRGAAGRGHPAPAALGDGRAAPAATSGRADLRLAGLDDARSPWPPRSRSRSSSGATASCPDGGRLGGPRRARSWPGCWPRWRCCARCCGPCRPQGADVPVDEALRTWTAHLVTAAASVLALLPLGTLLLRAGSTRDRVTEGLDLLPVTLVAGGFSALAAGRRGGRLPAHLAAAGARGRPGARPAEPGGRLDARSGVRRAMHRCQPVVAVTGRSRRLPPPPLRGTAVTQGVGAPTQRISESSASLPVHIASRTVFVIVS